MIVRFKTLRKLQHVAFLKLIPRLILYASNVLAEAPGTCRAPLRQFSIGIITYNVLCRSRTIGKRSRLYSPTCCKRRETQKRPFTWATWYDAAVSRFHKPPCSASIWRVIALRVVVYAGCVTRTQTICRSRLFLPLLFASVCRLITTRLRSGREKMSTG